MNINVVITIYCQHNWIFLRQKKIISIHYLTGQNLGLSGLKNIWPVIMTGNLRSVICSPVMVLNRTCYTSGNIIVILLVKDFVSTILFGAC